MIGLRRTSSQTRQKRQFQKFDLYNELNPNPKKTNTSNNLPL
jgi:hypothetical protein